MKKLFGKRGIALLTTLALLVSVVAMLSGLSVTSNAAYNPKRTVTYTVSEGIQQSSFMLSHAFKVAAGKNVVIKGYYKLDSINGTALQIRNDGVVVTEPTNGWVEFAVDYTVPGGEEWRNFGFWEASGTFAFADITIEDATTGEVLYDFATDTAVPAGTNTYDATNKGWSQVSVWYLLPCYGTVAEGATCTVTIGEALEGEKPEEPKCTTHHTWGEDTICDVCGAERPTYDVIEGDTSYVPKRVMSVTGRPGAIEAKILIIGSGTQFGKGKVIVLKGKYKVEDYDVALTSTDNNVQIGICDNAVGGVSVKGNTNGWVDFELRYVTSDDAWLKFGHWFTYGTVSIADVVAYDTNGNVLYEMATDEALTPGKFGPEYTEDESMWLPKYGESYGMWYLGYYAGGDAKDACSGYIDPVYVPEVEDPCADGHNFENGTCTNCGAADPDYVPPTDDPCADGHNFENGTCTDCGAADPDFVEPPAQTGDYSMIVFAAMGMMSAAGASALVLNKKKFSV